MNMHKGFINLGSMLASAMLSFGGLGSLMFMSQVNELYPSNSWKDLFHDKREAIASVVESMMITPSATITMSPSEDKTPTPTLMVTVTPTPTTQVSPSVTPTPTPTPTGTETADDDDNDQNEAEEEQGKRDGKKNQIQTQARVASSGDGWLKYKLMLFAKAGFPEEQN